MSVLVLVRHGQATSFSGDYDRLSSLGQKQSRLLGDDWADRELVLDRVGVGPRRRHQQTCAAVASVYRERGLPWPDPMVLPELDEYQTDQILERTLPDLVQRDPAIREVVATFKEGGETARRQLGRVLMKVTRMWVRGELNVPDVESWPDFRARVEIGIKKMTEAIGSGKTIAAFTSGGPVATAVGCALGLDDEKTLELSWIVRNASYSEFLFSGDRFSLHSFNNTPHLTEPALLTYR